MNSKDLIPAGKLAINYGCKAVVYGEPGSGKTPIINTAPRPMLVACEPGLLSMRGSTVPTWEAYTPAAIDAFFDWIFSDSKDLNNFDSIGFDSASECAETYLVRELSKTSKSGAKVNGEAAYGEMAAHTMNKLRGLYFLRNKHVYLICKQQNIEDGSIKLKRPYFPGRVLNVAVTHLYDLVLHLADVNIPGVGLQKAFRTKSSFDIVARDRSGKLAEFEPPNLTALFSKVTS